MDCAVYIRWSSVEQGKGSSLERQRELCADHAKSQGWRIVREIIDDGVSAYKGQHALTGELGAFVRDVEEDQYPDGVILLCEKLDRLSREEPSRVFVWMMRLADAGVTIATAEGGRTYSRGNFDMASIIEVVVKAQLSHEESEKKSQRVSAAWAAKRKRLAAGDLSVMTRRVPGWIEVVGAPPRFSVIPERAAIVRRIFEYTAGGFGKAHIARNLNRDGVEPFGRADGWHASYVQKILRSTAVLGEFRPGRKPRGAARTLGDVVQGYYPQIIDAHLYQRAMAAMAERSRQHSGRGRRLANILSGLAKCGHCGSGMTFRAKGRKQRADGTWVQEDYLVCDGYQRGRGCLNNVHFNYAIWSEGVLDPIIFEALKDDDFVPQAHVQTAEIELAEKERQLKAENDRAAEALSIAIETKRPEARAAWLEITAQVDEITADVDELRARLIELRGTTSPEEHQSRIEELRESMHSDDEDLRFEARSKIRSALQSLVDEMTFTMNPRGVTMRIGGDRIVGLHYDDMAGGTDWTMYREDGQAFSVAEYLVPKKGF